MDFEFEKKSTITNWKFSLDTYTLKNEKFDGTMSDDYERVVFERGDSVAALLVDEKKETVILVKQFRAPVAIRQDDDPWVLELVAGTMDEDGESPADTIKREIEEETPNIVIESLSKIFEVYPSPGACSEKIHIFIAKVDSSNVASFGGLADHNEDIKIVEIPFEDLANYVTTNKINTGPALIAIQQYQMLALIMGLYKDV